VEAALAPRPAGRLKDLGVLGTYELGVHGLGGARRLRALDWSESIFALSI